MLDGQPLGSIQHTACNHFFHVPSHWIHHQRNARFLSLRNMHWHMDSISARFQTWYSWCTWPYMHCSCMIFLMFLNAFEQLIDFVVHWSQPVIFFSYFFVYMMYTCTYMHGETTPKKHRTAVLTSSAGTSKASMIVALHALNILHILSDQSINLYMIVARVLDTDLYNIYLSI